MSISKREAILQRRLRKDNDQIYQLQSVLRMMVNTFNVKEIDPLLAFAVIEKARTLLP